MTSFMDSIQNWPAPSVTSIPLRVEKGREFGAFHYSDLPEFVGQLFRSTDAQAIRIEFTRSGPEFYRASVAGTGCPPVPYSTLSGEYLPSFMEFCSPQPISIWLHRENWFWVEGLEEEDLEKLTDSFIHSL